METAVEKPFTMLSVYLTTIDVYNPPMLAMAETGENGRRHTSLVYDSIIKMLFHHEGVPTCGKMICQWDRNCVELMMWE